MIPGKIDPDPDSQRSAHITDRRTRRLGDVFVSTPCTDGTQDLARDAGATVVEHKFETYSRQKNWGLDNLPMTGEWVFILDADERITPPLARELRAIAEAAGPINGYFVNRVVIFTGREIRHGGLYPSWNLRYFRRGLCRYEDRAVHEHMVCEGQTAYSGTRCSTSAGDHLRGISVHIATPIWGDEWIRRRFGQPPRRHRHLFRDILRIRQWLRRELWPRLPFRPFVRFIYMYFIRLGILDGRAGLHLALLMASYEYMISMLYRDKLQRIKSGLIPPPAPPQAPPPVPPAVSEPAAAAPSRPAPHAAPSTHGA